MSIISTFRQPLCSFTLFLKMNGLISQPFHDKGGLNNGQNSSLNPRILLYFQTPPELPFGFLRVCYINFLDEYFSLFSHFIIFPFSFNHINYSLRFFSSCFLLCLIRPFLNEEIDNLFIHLMNFLLLLPTFFISL